MLMDNRTLQRKDVGYTSVGLTDGIGLVFDEDDVGLRWFDADFRGRLTMRFEGYLYLGSRLRLGQSSRECTFACP